MAITGTLLADFTSFYDATNKAEASLKSMDAAANKTGRMLDSMVEGFDTGPAVKEAKQLELAFDTVAATASSKTAPALTAIGSAAGGAADKTNTFHSSFQQVDKVLGAAGVKLGPIPGALDELAAAAGKTATELGGLATAGLVVGAAMTGWNIGRVIADLTGADKWISQTTASLLGWGDAAGQEAAAAAETLARASVIAGRDITSMDMAVRILTENTSKLSAEEKQAAAEVEKAAAARKKAEAEMVAFSDKLFSRDDIARANLYADALGDVANISLLTTDKKKELKKAVDDALAAYSALGEKAPGILQAIARATTELIPITQSFSAANSKLWVEYPKGLEDGKKKMAEIAVAAEAYDREIEDAAIAAYDAIQNASSQTADTQIADAARAADATVLSWSQAMDAVRQGQGTMTGTGTADLTPSGKDSTQRAWNEGRYYGPVVGGSASNPRGTGPDFAALGYRASGGPVSANAPYVVGERGPELFVPSTSGAVRANASAGAVTVNISTVMGDPQEIARVVSAALLDAARARGERLPMGL